MGVRINNIAPAGDRRAIVPYRSVLGHDWFSFISVGTMTLLFFFFLTVLKSEIWTPKQTCSWGRVPQVSRLPISPHQAKPNPGWEHPLGESWSPEQNCSQYPKASFENIVNWGDFWKKLHCIPLSNTWLNPEVVTYIFCCGCLGRWV